MTAVDELIAFVTACLDRVEQVALAANPGPWRRITDKDHLNPLTIFGGSYMGDQEKLRNVASLEYSWVKDGNAEHIVLHDPAHTLADVAAKRRIVDRCEFELRAYVGSSAQVALPWLVVKQLAQAHAGWDGWREEWREEWRT